MKKWVLMILSTMLLFSVKNCYANDSNIKVDTYRNENFVVEFSIGDDKVYGFTTTLDFDSSKFKLTNCTAHNGYEISTHEKNIVVESITAKKNVKAATCYFEILDTKETSLAIKNINTGNYDEVSVEKDMQLKVLGNKTPTQVENIPDTAEGIGMGYILLGCTLTICGGVIIFLLFNKKYSILCSIAIALCLAIPGRVDAAKDKINLSEEDLSGARDILLGKEDSNLDYDFDGDEKITINDLVITKVDLSRLQVSFIPSGSHGKTAYTDLSMKYKIDSTSQIENVEYCAKSISQTCNYQKVNKTFTNSYLSEPRTFTQIGNIKQQMCVKVTNKEGLTRNVCSTGYLVDQTMPSISSNSSKSNTINGCYNFYGNLRNEKDSYFTGHFGFSGGSTSATIASGSNNGFGFVEYTLNGTATGNNGKVSSTSRLVRCYKKIAFVGDSLMDNSVSNYTQSLTVSPMIKNIKLVNNLSDLNISSVLTDISEQNDYVVATFAIRNGKLSLSNFTNILSRVRTSNPYAKIIIVIFGNDSSYSLTKTFVTRAYNYGNVVDCSLNSSCYNKIASSSGFASKSELFLNSTGSGILYNSFIKSILN